MHGDSIAFTIFLIFTGAAVLATVALYLRQALLVSYILLGVLLGPSGLRLVDDPETVRHIADFGIMFLLFLLGLNMYPQKLVQLVRETTLVTGVSSALFAALGYAFGMAIGLPHTDSLIVGAALMFSSTIIGLKLLPTTVLHHRHTGEVIISILLLQDIIAIAILLWLELEGRGRMPAPELVLRLLALPALVLFCLAFARFVLLRLIARFDQIQEYIFLLTIGWCLGVAHLADLMGLSHEMGAFIAGVSLATSRISDFIADSLRPLRDFFLVIFFFTLGALLDLAILRQVLVPGLILAALIMLAKPTIFRFLLRRSGEASGRSTEIGVRLGQVSEFSLFIAIVAMDAGMIGSTASYLIQVSTIVTFVASSSLIVMRYPTPIAVSDRLRRD